jgi:hypothetical protein
MEASNTDKVYAELFNRALEKYCKEMGFESYLDYEFLVFYATRADDQKAVGAISGSLKADFLEGVSSLFSQIKNGMNNDNQGNDKGLVDHMP